MKWKSTVEFPLILGVLGWIFSSRSWILFLNKQSPPVGLVFYYCILFVTILILQRVGLIIAHVPFDSLSHALGTLMIIFSFFIVFDWESSYINQVIHGQASSGSMSNIFFQSEDGSVYYFWYNQMRLHMNQARFMTYVITPIVLSCLGMILIHGRPLHWNPW